MFVSDVTFEHFSPRVALPEVITAHFHRCYVGISGLPGRIPVLYSMVWFEPSLGGCGVVLFFFFFDSCLRVRTYGYGVTTRRHASSTLHFLSLYHGILPVLTTLP